MPSKRREPLLRLRRSQGWSSSNGCSRDAAREPAHCPSGRTAARGGCPKLAVLHHWRVGGCPLGEPRLTRDVDITLFTGFGAEESIARALLELFEPRIADALDFALVNRVLLLRGSSGVPMDIALAGFPFEAEIIDRASTFEYLPGQPSCLLYTSPSPRD